MEQEEYIVDEHKVTHRVHLGDKEIFLAVQQDVNSTRQTGVNDISVTVQSISRCRATAPPSIRRKILRCQCMHMGSTILSIL